jgi:hypothetical protein
MAFETAVLAGSFKLDRSPGVSAQIQQLRPTLLTLGWPAEKIEALRETMRHGERILFIGYGAVKIASAQRDNANTLSQSIVNRQRGENG